MKRRDTRPLAAQVAALRSDVGFISCVANDTAWRLSDAEFRVFCLTACFVVTFALLQRANAFSLSGALHGVGGAR